VRSQEAADLEVGIETRLDAAEQLQHVAIVQKREALSGLVADFITVLQAASPIIAVA